METVTNYTTEVGMMTPIEATPQIKMKKPAKDSSLGSLLLSGISTLPTIAYRWSWIEPVEKMPADIYPSLVPLRRLADPSYGREKLDIWLRDKSSGAPSIEEVWQITEKLPSLTELLLEERNNE